MNYCVDGYMHLWSSLEQLSGLLLLSFSPAFTFGSTISQFFACRNHWTMWSQPLSTLKFGNGSVSVNIIRIGTIGVWNMMFCDIVFNGVIIAYVQFPKWVLCIMAIYECDVRLTRCKKRDRSLQRYSSTMGQPTFPDHNCSRFNTSRVV
jgi:hypothetical protein